MVAEGDRLAFQFANQPSEVAENIGREPRLGPRLRSEGIAGLQSNRAGEFLAFRLEGFGNTRPRSRAATLLQAGKTLAAASTAPFTSAVSPRGTSAIWQRFAGFSTLTNSPDMLSIQVPSINILAQRSSTVVTGSARIGGRRLFG
jgi:hypothetical protein